eukprot:NODE_17990_length_916_cov_5.437262.p4 GENE.NODE_17990_length_916_cov_5.437262~~NODE_17990_length_916_cov_5.437262.p4  ORF type:complete len:76 (-),score=10.49 NODE_17990_length_916_cov_5.437262:514-741(-)
MSPQELNRSSRWRLTVSHSGELPTMSTGVHNVQLHLAPPKPLHLAEAQDCAGAEECHAARAWSPMGLADTLAWGK